MYAVTISSLGHETGREYHGEGRSPKKKAAQAAALKEALKAYIMDRVQ